MKTANYYKNRPNELNKSLLTIIPESPRVPQSGLPSNYDWSMFDDENHHAIKNVRFDPFNLFTIEKLPLIIIKL